MNYRHIYHAGSFADVFKHAALCSVLDYLCLKDKPFCYIDSHAGIGLYDLNSDEATRSPEYQHGIAQLILQDHAPDLLLPYLNIVRSVQHTDSLSYYPGSPWIAAQYVRTHDQLILNELHQEDFATLKKNMPQQHNIHYHHRDAYEFLPAILPPTPPRALILMDPAYEQQNEAKKIIEALEKSIKRFAHGIYMLWYPIVDSSHKTLVHDIKKRIAAPIINHELLAHKKYSGLIGSGILIINPPFTIDQTLKTLIEYLEPLFYT